MTQAGKLACAGGGPHRLAHFGPIFGLFWQKWSKNGPFRSKFRLAGRDLLQGIGPWFSFVVSIELQFSF